MGLSLVLVLASLSGAEPIKLAAPSFQAVGIDAAKAGFFSDYLAQQLTTRDIHVTTASEIQALIGIERQKRLLTCDENSGPAAKWDLFFGKVSP